MLLFFCHLSHLKLIFSSFYTIEHEYAARCRLLLNSFDFNYPLSSSLRSLEKICIRLWWCDDMRCEMHVLCDAEAARNSSMWNQQSVERCEQQWKTIITVFLLLFRRHHRSSERLLFLVVLMMMCFLFFFFFFIRISYTKHLSLMTVCWMVLKNVEKLPLNGYLEDEAIVYSLNTA